MTRENAGRRFKASEPTYGVLNCLRDWEILISRMEEGRPRQERYMVHVYLNDLDVRGSIEDFLDDMPSSLRSKVGRCLEQLDARFRAVTREDGGAELSQYSRPLAEGREVRWWWTRRPIELPPGW
ncbi:hypothetical protein AB0L06_05620 [Spirillospora sp. NPDC052269]